MKSIFATLTVAALLSANVAYAKPPKGKPAASAKAKASFVCTLTELNQWSAPDGFDADIAIVVRMSCRNSGAKTVRIKVADVFLLNTDDQRYSPDDDSDAFDAAYEDEDPGPTFVRKFIDVAKGETQDFGFSFSGGNGLTDPHLTLDVNGTKYEHKRARSYDPNE